MNESLPSAPGAPTRALVVLDSGQEILVEFDPNQPRDRRGRWRKLLPSLPSGEPLRSGGEKDKLFLDPYHTTDEKRASPKFKPLAKPKSREEAREKVGDAPVLLQPQIEGMLRALEPGDSTRLPEGTLVAANEFGDGVHYRVDGPDGTFWRLPLEDAAELSEFEETTARANRFGESIPGNPMVPLPGVDVAPEDPIGDQIGGVLHGGFATLPRGTLVHRRPGEGAAGDTFDLKSPTGVTRSIPATEKDRIIAVAREFERMGEGKLGGDIEEKSGRTTSVKNPDGPLKPLPESFQQTRIALHAESERVLGFAHGGNEVALVQTPGGFGTPVYTDIDGQQTRWRIEGTDVLIEKFPFGSPDAVVVARDDIESPVDPASAQALADFYELADRVQRAIRAEGIDPGDTTDRRFDAPILWPEHFDIAIEVGEGNAENPGSRAVYGASPGDEGHPEPYFYVNPWALKPHDETWNANGFNGAELSFSEVLASDDQEALIRAFYSKYLTILGGNKPGPQGKVEADALAELMLAFDPNQPRDRTGKWRKTGISPGGGWSWDSPDVGAALDRLPDGLTDALKKRGVKITAAARELTGSNLPGIPNVAIDGIYYNKLTREQSDVPGYYVSREFIDTRKPGGQDVAEGKHETEWITLHETGHAFDDKFWDLATPRVPSGGNLPPRPHVNYEFLSNSEEWHEVLRNLDAGYLFGDHEFFADVFAEANGMPREGEFPTPEPLLDWVRAKMNEAAKA